MNAELKLYLYTTAHMSETDGKKVVSHYLPFVAMDDGAAVEMVKQSAKNLEGKVITEDKFLCRVGIFYPDRKRCVSGANADFKVVASLSDILNSADVHNMVVVEEVSVDSGKDVN